MKKQAIAFFAVITIIAFAFMGCPVSSKYPLGEKGKEPINKDLIGTWKNDSTGSEATKVIVSKGKETNTYAVEVTEKGGMFMAETTSFTGWLTVLDEKTFFVLQEIKEGTPTETYYVYHVKVDKNKLTTNDITLKVGGTDAIQSIETYREEVRASMKKEGFLAGEIVWKKQ